ncbi:hypothetical protein FLL45_18500 [Aliikangiella marina]|uniref:Uncharacterized protein n=1 Tax=Aliikangiella marina TaxID=1712262 RepID=A0A545T4P5_9GAMM|nr:hypothetical protein [Aliikangiella marina]TQV72210.1 hypothetical protein FLL45_18500 [Aliikangiella marina]
MKKLVSLLFASVFLVTSHNAFASNAWYWGKVNKIQTLSPDGSFLIYLENNTLKNTCRDNRVEFHVAHMGAERTQVAMSMALTAFTAGKEWGVVVNLPTTAESVCYASSTASQGAGIR